MYFEWPVNRKSRTVPKKNNNYILIVFLLAPLFLLVALVETMRKSRYQRLYIKAFNSKGKNRLQYAHLFNDLLQSSADDEIHQVYFYGHTIFTCIKHAELDRDTLVRLRTIAIEFNDYYRQLHPSPDAWSEEEIIKHYEHALATC